MDTLFIVIVVPFLLLIVAVISAIINSREYRRRRAEANTLYKNALAALENDPNNPGLRKDALEKGRIKAAIDRQIQDPEGKGTVTLFDETAIKNDMVPFAQILAETLSV